jgi:two-component system sensor histidine kinase NreB
MGTYLIMAVDLVMQITAASLAVRLIRVSRITAWSIIALALVMMALHRVYTFMEWFSTGVPPTAVHEIICLGASALMVAGVAFIGPVFRQVKESEEQLRQSEQKLRFLASQLLIAQEKERRKLAQELHEDLGQNLQALVLETSHIKQDLPAGEQGLCRECEDLLHHLRKMIGRIRSLSWALSPQHLEDLGLIAGLQHLIKEFCNQYGINQCRTDFDKIDNLFQPLAQLNIFRLCQEALSNMGEHAQATQVSLIIKKYQDKVIFVFTDNGRGFDVKEVLSQPGAGGVGLFTMDERAKLLGGSLQINSQPGRGTEVLFSAPIAAASRVV